MADLESSTYDVCVIGSGPAGGVLAKELAESGAKVALIEAGARIPIRDFHYHEWPYQYPKRVVPHPGYPKSVRDSIRYENTDPNVYMDRIRAVGGRSIHWNAACFRFAEWDFKEHSTNGLEEDWPLTYQELAPYYSYVEKMIGISGHRDGLAVVPDGEFIPPLKFRCSDAIVKRTCDKMGIPYIATRRAVLTKPQGKRPACHYCGHCMDGCDVGAIFSTPRTMIPIAQATGNFTLFENRLARELLVNDEGQVRAVSVVDTQTGRESQIQAKRFAVCCATIESARLLLNSKSPKYPNGLANSNDVVGRYLNGHSSVGVLGYLTELVGTKPVNNDGALDHTLIPRFNMNGKKRDYVGGFQMQNQFMGFRYPYQAQHVPGFGKQFKVEVRNLQPAFYHSGVFGKTLARAENRVTVDPSKTDEFGIPVPIINFRFCDNDRALFRDMSESMLEILHNTGVKLVFTTTSEPAGFSSHEVGTVRMGNDPKTSVLDKYNRAREVENLYVVDGSSFTTFPEKNPTLTIMALAVRAARHMTNDARGLNATAV